MGVAGPGRRRLLALAVAAAAGCTGGGEPADRRLSPEPTAAAPTTAPVAEGYRRIEVAADGLSVHVPVAWQAVPYDEAAIRDLVESSRGDNPELAAMLETAAGSAGEQAKLLVVDTGAPGANLNVLEVPHEQPVDRDELEQVRDGLLDPAVTAGIDAQLEAAGARDVKRDKAELTAGPALRASYVLPLQQPDGRVSDVSGVQYYVVTEDAVFVLSLSTPDLAAYAATFERIALSFTVR